MDFPRAAMALDAAVGVRLEGVQVVSQGASEEHRLLEDGFMDPLRKFRRKSGKSLVNLMEMLGTYCYSIFWGGYYVLLPGSHVVGKPFVAPWPPI